MPAERQNYKGREIIIETAGHGGSGSHEHKVHLSIDNKDIHVMSLVDGTFSTHYLPYAKFPTVLSLAKGLVDKVPLFSEGTRI